MRFKADGIGEMCWCLFTWRKGVTVEKPARLYRRLAGMCCAAHHSVAGAMRGGWLRDRGIRGTVC